MQAATLVDLTTYPISDLESPVARALIAKSRATLDGDGAVTLPGFLTESATDALTREAGGLIWASHEYASDHTVYFEPRDETRAADHVRRRTVRSDKGTIPYDRIPADALLRQLYNWDGLLQFVAAVLGEPQLHRHADPLAALNINTHGPGQQLGWHFDRTDFAVTLSLQQCEQGGEFEYFPNLRSADDENYDGVARVLAGSMAGVKRLDAAPGTLTLFRGHHSLHRVTPGTGSRKRLMAALSYVREPDVLFSPYARNLFYGRAVPLAPPAGAMPSAGAPATMGVLPSAAGVGA